jgi:TPR repeat protein
LVSDNYYFIYSAMMNTDDVELFTQPDGTHLGECPICLLPLPLDMRKVTMYSCCSKMVCNGCDYANVTTGKYICPFCREPALVDGEYDRRMLKRAKANDQAAMKEMGVKLYHEGDYDRAFQYLTKAAELGNAAAHYELGIMYREGQGVQKDEKKEVHHYEKAAIGGHPDARHNLGCIEASNGNMERSVKHFIIAANLGCDSSMKLLWKHYSAGNITKEELEATLRTHQAAIDATKSPERVKVEEAIKNGCPIAAIKLE